MRSIARPPKTKSRKCRFALRAPKLPRVRSNQMMHFSGKHKSIFIAFVLCFSACADEGPSEATPEATKKFLKLRGYEFDEPSFFKAAAAGDALAVNGFLSAGMDVNAKDQNNDTA